MAISQHRVFLLVSGVLIGASTGEFVKLHEFVCIIAELDTVFHGEPDDGEAPCEESKSLNKPKP